MSIQGLMGESQIWPLALVDRSKGKFAHELKVRVMFMHAVLDTS
jgi:hypothetical protein